MADHPVCDPLIMALRGRIGAHVLHARYDPQSTTAAARKAFLRQFERTVDPDGILSPEERARRADHERRAHMARLAYRSAMARRKRAARRAPEPRVPDEG